ncbi:hypothetical protein LWM68_15660 [Niabella sp. W65]|nr:hypothetical protein [Niabella sp. W65]MCH7364064.1 hypothetical protein [Niabella sp. W65]ULT39943.1 hypothetical protein KRR40_34480 [Niabella sp. I65]
MDNGFFQQITTPMQSASGLMVNMESFMKQLETAKNIQQWKRKNQTNRRKSRNPKTKI